VADWLERAAGPGGITLSLIYLELVLALTLLTTALHYRRLERTRGELRAVRLYFLAVFVLFLALPCALTALSSPRPAAALAGFGWTFGRTGLGLKLVYILCTQITAVKSYCHQYHVMHVQFITPGFQ
jgi:hypothetical protein